ncbi:MAG TPA: hypothetical protein VE978_05095 [Chitinophagales bacterium]|nr:hypothetical protein [Chitinophagales bacterium]
MIALQVLSILVIILTTLLAVYQLKSLRERSNLIYSYGTEIKLLATSNTNKRIIKDRIYKMQIKFSDWSLLMIADAYSWPLFAITCLPKLLFISSVNPKIIVVWKEIMQFIPSAIEYKVIGEFCNGEVLKLKLSKDAQLTFNVIGSRIEDARNNNPYQSYSSLQGVVNQIVNEVELEFKSKGEVQSTKDIHEKRMQFLKKQFDINMGEQ